MRGAVFVALGLVGCGSLAVESAPPPVDAGADAATFADLSQPPAHKPDPGVHQSGTTVNLRGVYAISETDAWAVGGGGTILHWDGAGWSPSASGTTNGLDAVAGSGSSDVWAVGAGGTIVHWNGNRWEAAPAPQSGYELFSVFARTATDAWAAGEAGLILRWQGDKWSQAPAQLTAVLDLDGVWASSADDVWAVSDGEIGAIEHWDGASFTVQPPPLGLDSHTGLMAVWGSGADDVWLSTVTPQILRWNGMTWSDVTPPLTGFAPVVSFWGRGPRDVWTADSGGVVRHWDGAAWSSMAAAKVGLRSISGDASGVWAVGDGGTIIRF